MVTRTKELLRSSSGEAKAEVESAVNNILDTVQKKLTDKEPEKAKEMY